MDDQICDGKLNQISNSSVMGKVAIFWDESFLWGLIAYDTFLKLSINFDVLTSVDIRNGALYDYDLIFVPGGWASNKVKALGETGKRNIQRFVESGGSYLGFCGGAGLALTHKHGLGLAPISRKATKERVPSFSGKIKLTHERSDHPVWKGIKDRTAFHAWWPGQFSIDDGDPIGILASYGTPEPGAYVADLLIEQAMDWDSLEKSYGTNLNPKRIEGEPALIEARYGKGIVILSYLHFETPGDTPGHKVLLNTLEYLAGRNIILDDADRSTPIASAGHRNGDRVALAKAIEISKKLEAAAAGLMEYGESKSLWFWRAPWIIQWRRGVRGIEYCTLYTMLKRLSEIMVAAEADSSIVDDLEELKGFSLPFFDKARELLALEHDAISNGPISPLEIADERIGRIREELFSGSKSFGGYFKQIIDKIDNILLPALIYAKEKNITTQTHNIT